MYRVSRLFEFVDSSTLCFGLFIYFVLSYSLSVLGKKKKEKEGEKLERRREKKKGRKEKRKKV